MGEVKVQLGSFLTSSLDTGKSAARPGHFSSWESSPTTNWIEGWVGPRASLNTEEEKNLLPLPSFFQSLYQVCYPSNHGRQEPTLITFYRTFINLFYLQIQHHSFLHFFSFYHFTSSLCICMCGQRIVSHQVTSLPLVCSYAKSLCYCPIIDCSALYTLCFCTKEQGNRYIWNVHICIPCCTRQ